MEWSRGLSILECCSTVGVVSRLGDSRIKSGASFVEASLARTSLPVDFLRVPLDLAVPLVVLFVELIFAPPAGRSWPLVEGANFKGSMGGFFRTCSFFSISCFPISSFCDKVGWNDASKAPSALAEGFSKAEARELRTPVCMGRGDLGVGSRSEPVFVAPCPSFVVLLAEWAF